MVDVRIRMREQSAPLVRICCEVLHHVFVDFFLQIEADGSVCSDNLVGADARVGGDVSTGVWDADVGRYIADRMMRPLDGGGDQPA